MQFFVQIILGYLSVITASVYSPDTVPHVYFDLPQANGAYTGKLSKNSQKVELTPPLRAFTDSQYSTTRRICGFHTIWETQTQLPFDVDVTDPRTGSGEIRVREDSQDTIGRETEYMFQIEAFDCDTPRHFSRRVFVRIAIQSEPELGFTQSEYQFSISTYVAVGSIVSKVTVVHEAPNIDPFAQNQCGYSIPAGDLVPFSIDSYGVIRTKQVLTAGTARTFSFQVIYRDCSDYQPKIASANVNVNVIQTSCTPKWQGLPHHIKHSQVPDQPERLLWPPNFVLNTCGATCPPQKESNIIAELRLRSPGPNNYPLLIANSSFCRHNPRSLQKQRKICDINPATILNLLPNPTRNIRDQVNYPGVGTVPEPIPLSMSLLFNASEGTGWRVDNQLLMGAAQVRRQQLSHEIFPQPELRTDNLFERDFTLSFWLQRKAMRSDDHETILCSQENTVTMGRALWIGFKGCTIIVQMITRDPTTNMKSRLAFRIYSFPELPVSICPRKHLIDEQWHHYSISVALDPITLELTDSALMVDGETIGKLILIKTPPVFNRPSTQYFSQYITVGTAYDPKTQTSQQSLNGALTGLMLLIGQKEDESSLRCIADCGETLLLPRATNYLSQDIDLLLNSDSISVKGKNVSEIVNILANIAYVKPDDTSTALQFDNNVASSKRVLELHTMFSCGDETLVNITMASIDLEVEHIPRSEEPEPAMGQYQHLETAPLPDASVWIPKTEMEDMMVPLEPKLSVVGQSLIRAEVPTMNPGIPMFPELSFTLVNTKLHTRAAQRAASDSILDQCLVIPLNGGSLKTAEGERVNLPRGRIHELGLTVDPSSRGILLNGSKRAGEYASLLHGFRYLPPTEVDKKLNDPSLATGVLWTQQFELICSSGKLPVNTDPFIVKIMLTAPGVMKDFSGRMPAPARGYVNGNDLDDYDEEEDDDDYNYDNADYGYSNYGLDDLGLMAVDYAKSDKNVRPASSLNLVENEAQAKPKFNVVGLSVTVSLVVLTLVALIAILITRNTTVCLRYRPSFLKRSGRSNGTASGRLEFRMESDLNVIENPIDKLESGSCMDWQSGKNTASRVPGVHKRFAGATDTSGVQQSEAEDQFDDETRSFNGLFEVVTKDGCLYPEETAQMEEVDDFDESESIRGHTNIHDGDEQQDDDYPSDDSEETFSVGRSHLEFVTLPSNNRKQAESHHVANI